MNTEQDTMTEKLLPSDKDGHLSYTEEKRDSDEDSMGMYIEKMNIEQNSDGENSEAPPVLPFHKILLLNLSWLGISMQFLLLSLVVVPAQIRALVGPELKGRVLGGMVAGGAVLLLVVSPLVGMKSDRVISRFGRRRPVIMFGVIGLFTGLLGMGLSAPKVHVHVIKPPFSTDNGSHPMECPIVDLVTKRCEPYKNKNESLLPHLVEEDSEMSHAAAGSVVIPNRIPDVEVSTSGPPGNLGLYIFFYLVMSSSSAVITVPYSALVADESNPDQRGLNSGIMGGMTLVGNVLGAILGLFFVDLGVLPTYGIATLVFLACILTTVFSTTESPSKPVHEPIMFKELITGFWEPLKDLDFRWVFLTRFFMQQGISTVTAFLQYWLADMIELPPCWSAEKAVAVSFIPLLFAAVISCLACGVLSDRIHKRKPIILAGGLMMFAMSLVLAFLRGDYSYYIAIVCAFVFGVGYGCFNGVDFALVMDVLPAEKDKAKDIAVWQQALVLPQALATPIGGLFLDLFEQVDCEIGLGYIIVFLMTAVYFFLSGVFVVKIKGAV